MASTSKSTVEDEQAIRDALANMATIQVTPAEADKVVQEVQTARGKS